MESYINKRVKRLVEDLNCGDLTLESFHNKKAGAKRSGKIVLVLDLAIAYELHKNQIKNNE